MKKIQESEKTEISSNKRTTPPMSVIQAPAIILGLSVGLLGLDMAMTH